MGMMQRMVQVSTHSRPKAAGLDCVVVKLVIGVSTHSRPKAAGYCTCAFVFDFASFNTQPPEGGWCGQRVCRDFVAVFQHTAARRRLVGILTGHAMDTVFQHTAARRRLDFDKRPPAKRTLFQHTAARRRLAARLGFSVPACRFQHTAARRRLVWPNPTSSPLPMFQHTAARRRLVGWAGGVMPPCVVSTHSRPKAAGASLKSLAPSGFAALISLSSQEKCKREYNTAFSVTPAFAIS